MKGEWRVVTVFFFFWMFIMLYMSIQLYQSCDTIEYTPRQLAKAFHDLDLLKKQNIRLQELANQLINVKLEGIQLSNVKTGKEVMHLKHQVQAANRKLGQKVIDSFPPQGHGVMVDHAAEGVDANKNYVPSLEQEELRRKIEKGVNEMWYQVQHRLDVLKEEMVQNTTQAQLRVTDLLEDAADHRRVLLTDLYNLSTVNGADEWRRREAEELSNIVQNRIRYLQNPRNCHNARKLVCNINKSCGYGCQLHHLVYCFIIAYGTERTLILESKRWKYSKDGWEKFFLPLSETCSDGRGQSQGVWGTSEMMAGVQVIKLPIIDSLKHRPPFIPQAIPEDLAPRLMRLHGHPFVWWMAQFLKYMLRPQPWLAKDIEQVTEAFIFKSPIVGVHVRRTDKIGREAAIHDISKYMMYVDEYYDLLQLRQPVDQKHIYLATDDPNLLSETREKYPQYEVISENEFSKSAGLSTRYTEPALRALIMDVHFLSHSDYLVCTFSSQVCRLVYEIMQTLHPDGSARFKSLDDIYYFGGQNGHTQMALYPHSPRTKYELKLMPGDHVGIAGNHWDGYSKGTNLRTHKVGLYPSYKTIEDVDIVKFPTYPDANR